MIGVSYAMVPIYKMFCAATGYGGAVKGAKVGVGNISISFAHTSPYEVAMMACCSGVGPHTELSRYRDKLL